MWFRCYLAHSFRGLDLLLSPGCQAALWELHLRGEAWTQAFPPPLLPCPSLPIPAAERRRERELRSIGGAGGGNWELSLELGGWWLGVRSSLHSWECLQRVSVSWGFATPSPFITVHSPAHRLPPTTRMGRTSCPTAKALCRASLSATG